MRKTDRQTEERDRESQRVWKPEQMGRHRKNNVLAKSFDWNREKERKKETDKDMWVRERERERESDWGKEHWFSGRARQTVNENEKHAAQQDDLNQKSPKSYKV